MSDNPHRRGVVLAVFAAIAFGLATPLVAHAGAGIGPFTTAAGLYAGAMLVGGLLRRWRRGAGRALRRTDAWRLVAMALLGATVAPSLLAFGLQHTSPTSASLVLNLEAVFTLALAAVVYREPLGVRAIGGAVAMLVGGAVLVLQGGVADAGLGLLAVALATAAWALDNTLSRPLAEAEPLTVVALKAGLGAGLAAMVALALGEPAPPVVTVLTLMAIGAVGYGGSLALYLAAQRHLGAGRTGSVFALGPFVGALVAVGLGDRDLSWLTAVAAALFAVGVWLHLHERHGHEHSHPEIEHEHFHRHDDGHHRHAHDAHERVPEQGHSHVHRHAPLVHDHAHAPDLHHVHEHARFGRDA